MAFYKLQDKQLQIAPNYVIAPDYELKAEDKDTYTYPVNGWYWFDTDEDAINGLKDTSVQEVPMWAARAVLEQAGYLEAINAALASDVVAKNKWEYATVVKRDDALITDMQQVLGLSDIQVDELFTKAGAL